jgi:hypothetical protein
MKLISSIALCVTVNEKTDSMQLSSPSETGSILADEEIIHLLWNLKVYNHS